VKIPQPHRQSAKTAARSSAAIELLIVIRVCIRKNAPQRRERRHAETLGRINSINVQKVLWALEELKVPYERTDAACNTASSTSLSTAR